MSILQRNLHLALALIAGACGSETTPGQDSGAAPDGAALYNDRGAAGCVLCHGSDGSGTLLGVDLTDKRARWTVVGLMAYIEDPEGYASRTEGVDHTRMPTPPEMSAEDRATLARYTLTLMDAKAP